MSEEEDKVRMAELEKIVNASPGARGLRSPRASAMTASDTGGPDATTAPTGVGWRPFVVLLLGMGGALSILFISAPLGLLLAILGLVLGQWWKDA